jgi:SLT domain-containing protein
VKRGARRKGGKNKKRKIKEVAGERRTKLTLADEHKSYKTRMLKINKEQQVMKK